MINKREDVPLRVTVHASAQYPRVQYSLSGKNRLFNILSFVALAYSGPVPRVLHSKKNNGRYLTVDRRISTRSWRPTATVAAKLVDGI